jgi:hypothetical protein
MQVFYIVISWSILITAKSRAVRIKKGLSDGEDGENSKNLGIALAPVF